MANTKMRRNPVEGCEQIGTEKSPVGVLDIVLDLGEAFVRHVHNGGHVCLCVSLSVLLA